MQTLYKWSLLILVLLGFCACDEVDEADRFTGPVEFVPKKNVLIEDFTGQRCLNCPLAADAVHAMQATYGAQHVIAVAIHGGSLSLPASSGVGLALPEGETYQTFWGVSSWPKGLVDRGGGWSNPSEALLEYTSWSAAAVKRLQVAPAVDMTLLNTYEAETGQLTMQVDIKANQPIKDGYLQVWLTESGIKAYQTMPDGSHNREYVHDHVLRAIVNGQWGEPVALNATDDTHTISYTYALGDHPTWKADKMAVVAFVYSKTGGVLQVIDSPVVE